MTWQIEFLEEAKNDLKNLDRSSQIQILKGIHKVSQNPLSRAAMASPSAIKAEPILQTF